MNEKILSKEELMEINKKIESLKSEFIISASKKDLRQCKKIADEIADITKIIKKQEKLIKKQSKE